MLQLTQVAPHFHGLRTHERCRGLHAVSVCRRSHVQATRVRLLTRAALEPTPSGLQQPHARTMSLCHAHSLKLHFKHFRSGWLIAPASR